MDNQPDEDDLRRRIEALHQQLNQLEGKNHDNSSGRSTDTPDQSAERAESGDIQPPAEGSEHRPEGDGDTQPTGSSAIDPEGQHRPITAEPGSVSNTPQPAQPLSDPIEDTEHSVLSTEDESVVRDTQARSPKRSSVALIQQDKANTVEGYESQDRSVAPTQHKTINTVESGTTSIAHTREAMQLALRLEAVEAICLRMAAGESIKKICRDADMPDISTVFRWLRDNPELGNMYHTALQFRAAGMAEELVDHMTDLDRFGISTERVQALKVMINTKQWIMSRLLPKQYGDRETVEHVGTVTLDETAVNAKLESLISKLSKH